MCHKDKTKAFAIPVGWIQNRLWGDICGIINDGIVQCKTDKWENQCVCLDSSQKRFKYFFLHRSVNTSSVCLLSPNNYPIIIFFFSVNGVNSRFGEQMYQMVMAELTQWWYDIDCKTQLDTFCPVVTNYNVSGPYHRDTSQVAVGGLL